MGLWGGLGEGGLGLDRVVTWVHCAINSVIIVTQVGLWGVVKEGETRLGRAGPPAHLLLLPLCGGISIIVFVGVGQCCRLSCHCDTMASMSLSSCMYGAAGVFEEGGDRQGSDAGTFCCHVAMVVSLTSRTAAEGCSSQPQGGWDGWSGRAGALGVNVDIISIVMTDGPMTCKCTYLDYDTNLRPAGIGLSLSWVTFL